MSYSSYDAEALATGVSMGIVLLSYGIALLITIIVQVVASIPYYKMAKNAGIRHAWVSFVPFGYYYMATILPKKEFNLFNKFIWPNRAKAFWVYIISLIIYMVLIFPITLLALIPILGWLLFMVYIVVFVGLWYVIMWRVHYDLLMTYGMEEHAMWASILSLFMPIVMIVFSYIIMNREPNYYYE